MVKNEHGGVMIFVLMIIAVLMLATPVIIQMTKAADVTERQYTNAVKANQLAVGSIEAFLTYLQENERAGNDMVDTFNRYAGWGSKKIKLPEGGLLVLSQTLQDRQGHTLTLPLYSFADALRVVVKAEAGAGRTKREKQLVYEIQGGGSCEIIRSDSKFVIDPEYVNTVIVGSRYSDNVKDIVNMINGLQQAILDHMMTYVTDIDSRIAQYEAAAQYCGSCHTLEQIQNVILNSDSTPENPLILRVNQLYFNQNEVITLGSASKPVILLADSLTLDHNNTGLTVYGNLIFTNGIHANQSATISVRSVNDETGNMWVSGGVNFNGTNNWIEADETFFAKSMNLNQNLELKAKNMITSGRISVTGNNTKLIAEEQMIAHTISVERNHTELSVTAGDMFIYDQLVSLAQHTSIVTGGMIAVGGSFDMQRDQFTIETGSTGETSINLGLIGSDDSVSCDGDLRIYRIH